MNAQHEQLEQQGVKALIAKKFYGKKKQGQKVLKKWQTEEKAEQKMESAK